jgi:hypothetical protein
MSYDQADRLVHTHENTCMQPEYGQCAYEKRKGFLQGENIMLLPILLCDGPLSSYRARAARPVERYAAAAPFRGRADLIGLQPDQGAVD